MDRLKDKVALITGAARGQGREMAELFMKEGARAVISTDVLDAKDAEKSPVTFLKQDVTKADQWKVTVDKIVADHGKIDILINNAAICLYEPILETTNEIYDRVLDIDLKSIFLGMKEVLPHMIKRKQGSIINVSSIWGLAGVPSSYAYQAAKGAILGDQRCAHRRHRPEAPRSTDRDRVRSALSRERRGKLRHRNFSRRGRRLSRSVSGHP
jgi:cyclopentanol dehydrogenase